MEFGKSFLDMEKDLYKPKVDIHIPHAKKFIPFIVILVNLFLGSTREDVVVFAYKAEKQKTIHTTLMKNLGLDTSYTESFRDFGSPVGNKKWEITSRYGKRIHPVTDKPDFHYGTDIKGEKGDPVYAVEDGRLWAWGELPRIGKYVMIKHAGGIYTVYGHLRNLKLAKRLYKKKQLDVKKGVLIGSMGNSGRSTGPHLHYEVFIEDGNNGRYHIDPSKLFYTFELINNKNVDI